MAQDSMKQRNNGARILVAYFSATGTTTEAAKKIAKLSNGELYMIAPTDPYTSADLDWHNKQSRSSVEMNDQKARPAIRGTKENIVDYEIIFIGYPIWWNLAPRVVNTFIESHKLKGKTVIPFATSGGSSIEGSILSLKKTYLDLNWKEGKLLNRVNEKIIREWLDKLGY